MKRVRRRSALVAFMALILSSLLPSTVLAAAPANDTLAAATTVAVGDTISESTLEATSDTFEESLNENCGAPVVEHGVWFEITPDTTQFVAFDTQDSDYSAGIMVFAGDPSAESLITCGPGRVAVELTADQQYFVMAFGDGLTTETSGNLVFKVEAAVPPPTLELTVNRTATVNRQGVVHLTGTITCTSEGATTASVELDGQITQHVGRFTINGFFFDFLEVQCDGTPQPWDAFVSGDNGTFAGGKAATVTFAFACTDLCSSAFVEQTVQLRRSGK